MYRLLLGSISSLSAVSPATELLDLAPIGPRRAAWLAGRNLLALASQPQPLPSILYSQNGKPYIQDNNPFFFNLSHSGDHIALLTSTAGDVGCDIEIIRDRKNWQAIAQEYFSAAEQKKLKKVKTTEQLAVFWSIWSAKEAILKMKGDTVWTMAKIDSLNIGENHLTQCVWGGDLIITACTSKPFQLQAEDIVYIT